MVARVTLVDRCLLHLLDRAGAGPEDPVAEELLQDRVAEALRVQRAHISRAMKKLAKRGFVREAKIHVRAERRRRVAYFLTDEGLQAAKRARERIEAGSVVVVDLEGREASRRLYEVPALLPRKSRFSDLVGAVEEGRLDLRHFLERQATVQRGRVYDVRGAITVPHFRGRDAILDRLNAFVADGQARGLVLLGLPGIGKTAVASRWVETLKGRRHVFWRRLQAGTSAGEIVRDLATMLHAAGRPALSDSLHRPPEGPQDARRLLQRDLAGVPAVLVVDDAHAAEGEVADLVAEFLRIDSDAAGPKVVLLAREVPRFLTAEDVARGRVWRAALDDLAPAEADAMVASMGVKAPRRAAILERCGGHPLSLELAAAGGIPPEAVRRASAAFLAETVLSGIDAADREALALAALFEDPVPMGALGAHAQRLLERSLLRDAGDGRVTVHDLVRDAVLDGLTPDKAADLHVRAAEILARGLEPRDALAALRHLVPVGAFREAEALAVARGEGIVDAGLAEPFASLLEQLAWTSRGGEDGPRLGLLHGHALSALGRWRDAARAYEACESTDARLSAEALLGRGKAELQRRSRLALPLLEKARDQLERFGALRTVAEAQYWIGCVYENAGRLDDAREAFERGRAIAFDVGDRRWEGMCAYGVGRICSRGKDYRGAVEEEKEALRLLEREGLRLEIAKVCAGLGGNLAELKQVEAEAYLDRAAREARGTGAIGILATTLYNLASMRNQAGRSDEAATLFREALGLFEYQEQYEWAARSAAWLAVCVSTVDAAFAEECFRGAEAQLARVREPATRAVTLRQLARASLQARRMGDARRLLTQAIAEARAGKLAGLVAELSAEQKALT